MYIEKVLGGYDRHGQQVARRGLFLILVQQEAKWVDGKFVLPKEIRALVRKVALHQSGHFMVGRARAFGERIHIDGAYGSNGLPRTVSDRVFERAVPLPDDLRELWNKGGGHNSAGSEAGALREWALANLSVLQGGK